MWRRWSSAASSAVASSSSAAAAASAASASAAAASADYTTTILPPLHEHDLSDLGLEHVPPLHARLHIPGYEASEEVPDVI